MRAAMIVNRNEVEALALKAARGAGAPPAQAAAFGRAARHHLAADRGEAALATALDALPGGAILDLPLALTRLMESASRGQARGTLPGDPALARSYAEALAFGCDTAPSAGGVSVTIDLAAPAAPVPPLRLALSTAFFDRLTDLATRTMVPETEASRQAGAGAGLTDND